MGIINHRFYSYLPNATVCKSNEPHVDHDHVVRMKVADIYGMLVLLAIGMGVSLITFVAENGKLLRQRTEAWPVPWSKALPGGNGVAEHSQGPEGCMAVTKGQKN